MDEREIVTLELCDAEEIAALECDSIQEIAVLEEGAGVSLAPLVNGAAADDILSGKAAYAADGSVVEGAIEAYEGSATVTPRVEPQKLDTARKYMRGDITVQEIPYYSVDNDYNGQTVIIGE